MSTKQSSLDEIYKLLWKAHTAITGMQFKNQDFNQIFSSQDVADLQNKQKIYFQSYPPQTDDDWDFQNDLTVLFANISILDKADSVHYLFINNYILDACGLMQKLSPEDRLYQKTLLEPLATDEKPHAPPYTSVTDALNTIYLILNSWYSLNNPPITYPTPPSDKSMLVDAADYLSKQSISAQGFLDEASPQPSLDRCIVVCAANARSVIPGDQDMIEWLMDNYLAFYVTVQN